jgi:hypothetical protein
MLLSMVDDIRVMLGRFRKNDWTERLDGIWEYHRSLAPERQDIIPGIGTKQQ